MTDVVEERKKVHAELRTELFKRQLSNSENFDKAILTYSSAGLALSLGFLKDFIPITQACAAWLLFLSWGCFSLAIVTLYSRLFHHSKGSKNSSKSMIGITSKWTNLLFRKRITSHDILTGSLMLLVSHSL